MIEVGGHGVSYNNMIISEVSATLCLSIQVDLGAPVEEVYSSCKDIKLVLLIPLGQVATGFQRSLLSTLLSGWTALRETLHCTLWKS